MNNYLDEEQEDELNIDPIAAKLMQQSEMTTPVKDDMINTSVMDQEMSNSDEIEAQSQDLMSQMPQVPEASPEVKKLNEYKNMMTKMSSYNPQEIAKLQDDANSKTQGLNWFRLGDKIAQAYGQRYGGKVEGFQDLYDGLAKQVKQPIEDLSARQKDEATQMELGNERELNDLTSSASRYAQSQAKAVLKRLNPKISEEELSRVDELTAKQIQKIPGIGSMSSMNTERNRYQTKVTTDPVTKLQYLEKFDMVTGEVSPINEGTLAGYKSDIRLDPGSQELIKINSNLPVSTAQRITGPNVSVSKEANLTQPQSAEQNSTKKVVEVPKTAFEIKKLLDTKTFEILEETKADFTKETAEARRVVAGLDGTKSMLELAEKNPAGKPIAAAAITRLFEKGVLTDKDVERYVVRKGLFNSIEDYASALSSGTFSKAQVIQLAQVLDAYKQQQQDQIQAISNQKAENILGYIDPNTKISQKDISNMFYTPAQISKKSNLKENEVSRQTSDGKIAIFDTTKNPPKFLRFADDK